MAEPLGVALLGAGLFARDAYLPLLRQSKSVRLVAVWSRSSSAGEALLPTIQEFSPHATACSGEPGLQALLRDAAISAVLVVLPVDVAPDIALRFLAAGKHVLQEKPAAPDVATALAAMQRHATLSPPRPLWAIAENYRSERVFRDAASALARGALGDVIKLDLAADMPMNAVNKYFSSAWRRDAAKCPGAFLMDSSVHFVAALRALAVAAGLGEAVAVAGRAYSTTDTLPAPDALVGYVGFRGGRGASVSISFGCALPRFSLAATGTRGALEVQRGGWAAGRGEYRLLVQAAGEAAPRVDKVAFSGLEDELAAFVAQVRGSGNEDEAYRISLAGGVRDLAVVEALLASSAASGGTVPVASIP